MANSQSNSVTVVFIFIFFISSIHGYPSSHHHQNSRGRHGFSSPAYIDREALRSMCQEFQMKNPEITPETPTELKSPPASTTANNGGVPHSNGPSNFNLDIFGVNTPQPIPITSKPGGPCIQRDHLIHKETGTCHQVGELWNTNGAVKPACNLNMKFYKVNNESIYGECDCERFVGSTLRPIVYWEPTDSCYPVFDRGPCPQGHWIVQMDNSVPVCTKRTCPENDPNEMKRLWIRYVGYCYQIYTQAFCAKNEDKLYYHLGDRLPKCGNTEPVIPQTRNLLSGAGELPCSSGHKKSLNGDCKKIIKFS